MHQDYDCCGPVDSFWGHTCQRCCKEIDGSSKKVHSSSILFQKVKEERPVLVRQLVVQGGEAVD